MAREVRVAILGDSRDFSRAVRNVQSDAGKLDGTFKGLKGLAGGLALGVAGREVFELGKGFVDAATESKKVTAQTDAVIKSMGNTAGVSAQQVADLSTQLSMKAGIDDELIQSGSNVLLTFGKVRNEVGKGNNIFDRATASALDMSVALGTDMKSASMLVGKALNDPIKGLATLRRSGVQFTAQQEDQIKAMVEAGDTAGAQKIMLKELEKQFGGSAAAQATATDKLKVAWGNIQEQLGEKLLPVVERVATWLADNLPGAMAKAQVASQRIADVVREHWPQIQAVIQTVVDAVRTSIEGFVSVATTLWENFGNNILEFVQRVWPRIQQYIQGTLDIIRGIIQTVTSLIKADWSGVWEGIKTILRGAWEQIQGIVGAAMETLRTALGVALEVLGSVFKGAWEGLVNWFKGIPEQIGSIASAAWNALKRGLRAAVDWIIGEIDRMLGPIDEALGKIAEIKELVPGNAKGDDINDIKAITDSHAQGGMVRGALGKPRLILAHGGERVLTHGEQMRGGSGEPAPEMQPFVVNNNFYGKVDQDSIGEMTHRLRVAQLEMAG